MSERWSSGYLRVVPRDLFNEASLLKCYGRLALELEGHALPGVQMKPGQMIAFVVQQDQSSGDISCRNIWVEAGERIIFFRRPLNARDPWPLWTADGETEVFTEEGKLSPAFLALLAPP